MQYNLYVVTTIVLLQFQSLSYSFVSSIKACLCLCLWVAIYYICIVLCTRVPRPFGKPQGFIAICNKIELESENKISQKLSVKVK